MRCLLATILTLASLSSVVHTSDDVPFSQIHSVLDDRYPKYEILEPKKRVMKRLSSPERYVNGVLVADFNGEDQRLSDADLEKGDPEVCQEKIALRQGRKSLSLVKPYGYCEFFFYPLDSGGSKGCRFCYH